MEVLVGEIKLVLIAVLLTIKYSFIIRNDFETGRQKRRLYGYLRTQ